MLYCVVWANICSGPGLDPKGRAFHRSRRVLNCLGLKHTVLCFPVCCTYIGYKEIKCQLLRTQTHSTLFPCVCCTLGIKEHNVNCLGLKHTVLCFVVVFYTASYFIQYCEAFSTSKSCFSAMLSALFLF